MAVELNGLVNLREGSISRRIFSDPSIYEEELNKVFTKCWAYIGHESQLAQPGDFVTNYIGEDPVVAVKDPQGRIRVFLNSCPHRGNKVCRVERGHASFFRCNYHGWTFDTMGRLTGVPEYKAAYGEQLAREKLGLVEVPRVESYRGFVFANWDSRAMSLADYLGPEHRWYLDLALSANLGGLEVLGPPQRYGVAGNWKIASENFSADDYHVLYTHASAFKIGFLPDYNELGEYTATFAHGHGIGDIPLPGKGFRFDQYIAQQLGPEAMDYLMAVREKIAKELTPEQVETWYVGQGTIFPIVTWLSFGVFRHVSIFQWHPRGPNAVEAWQFSLYDKAAPQVAKDYARRFTVRENAGGGVFGPDDVENFENVSEATRGYVSRQLSYDYSMGLDRQDFQPKVTWLPGRIAPHFTENGQRNFYRYWLELMQG